MLFAVHDGFNMPFCLDYVRKYSEICGSGFGPGPKDNWTRTGPEPDRTPRRFGVRPEGLNRTRFRFRVRKKVPPDRTGPDRGIPSEGGEKCCVMSQDDNQRDL